MGNLSDFQAKRPTQVCVEQPYVASKPFYLSLLLRKRLVASKLLRRIESLDPTARWQVRVEIKNSIEKALLHRSAFLLLIQRCS